MASFTVPLEMVPLVKNPADGSGKGQTRMFFTGDRFGGPEAFTPATAYTHGGLLSGIPLSLARAFCLRSASLKEGDSLRRRGLGLQAFMGRFESCCESCCDPVQPRDF